MIANCKHSMKEEAQVRKVCNRGAGLVGEKDEHNGERKVIVSLWPVIPDK